MALLSHDVRTADVVCEEAGTTFTLTQEAFTRVIMHNPKIADLIQRAVSDRKAKNRDLENKRRLGK